MIVKICGVKGLEELEIVEKYADAAGVVVKSDSKRCISLGRAREIINSTSIPVFAVSTSSSINEWEEIIAKCECNYIQVHSSIMPEDFEKLKEVVKVMKTFIVDKSADEIIREIELYSPHLILLDSGCGSGKRHDWKISREVSEKYDILLAGGLNPQNVGEAISVVKPMGVDVSSGVEIDGFKDEFLIREFVRRAKNEVR
ncbi:MAG: phosphoribosylanthranilate isomerase [Archaeoglobus sp.]|uniref:phosphoribosylanthranilate isomerase n=1 Tax=Archaeoglobus sp. TaxID=1872626 RepID=UPI001E185661|nr:phosphoribosylanthranilate isomerase [Archaeoglobus sp.]MBO8180776.1 phosphoribosylanthranilate isomerase [Archaeoglobus sp.]